MAVTQAAYESDLELTKDTRYLTLWAWDNMATNLLTEFWSSFSFMEISGFFFFFFFFFLKFHWNVFRWAQLAIIHHWLR